MRLAGSSLQPSASANARKKKMPPEEKERERDQTDWAKLTHARRTRAEQVRRPTHGPETRPSNAQ
jgi:hypothetical protein